MLYTLQVWVGCVPRFGPELVPVIIPLRLRAEAPGEGVRGWVYKGGARRVSFRRALWASMVNVCAEKPSAIDTIRLRIGRSIVGRFFLSRLESGADKSNII